MEEQMVAARRVAARSLALGWIALVSSGVPLPGYAQGRAEWRTIHLRPCKSVFSYSPSWAESMWTAEKRLGAGNYSPARGVDILEALVMNGETWGVSVYLPDDGAASVVHRAETRAGADAVRPGGEPRIVASSADIPRALALQINEVWRLHLSEARVGLAKLPPAIPGGVIGGCLDGTGYYFRYLSACAMTDSCEARADSVASRMVALVEALRDVARSTTEERDAALKALVARVAALE